MTVSRVLDPLVGSGAALVSGTRAVGVVVRIANHGPGVYDSSATGDISVVPSAGTATPAFASHGICQTPLRDFDNYITAGEIRHGCVAFAVSVAAKVIAVRFSPHGQSAGRATWVVDALIQSIQSELDTAADHPSGSGISASAPPRQRAPQGYTAVSARL